MDVNLCTIFTSTYSLVGRWDGLLVKLIWMQLWCATYDRHCRVADGTDALLSSGLISRLNFIYSTLRFRRAKMNIELIEIGYPLNTFFGEMFILSCQLLRHICLIAWFIGFDVCIIKRGKLSLSSQTVVILGMANCLITLIIVT